MRALKNRFGSTNEVGVFEMREGGLVEVLDASARFVGQATRAPGSVVLASMEGTRPLLVEVQALVSPSELGRRAASATASTATGSPRARGAGPPRRRGTSPPTCSSTSSGGVRVDEPGADLAIAVAVAGAARGVRPVRHGYRSHASARSA